MVVIYRIAEFCEKVIVACCFFPLWDEKVIDCSIPCLFCIGEEIVREEKPQLVFDDRTSKIEIPVIVREFIGLAHNCELLFAG